jgi:DNA-binding NarL/FixJ family response regulator
MASSGVINTVVIDDHPAIIAAVRTWCAEADPPIEVVDAGPTPAVSWTGPGREADVVILDLHLGNPTPAFGDLRRLVDDGRQVIVYSMRDEQDTSLTCLDIGAFTYLTKSEGRAHLVDAVRAAAENRPYTTPSLSGALGTDLRATRPRLTDREGQILLEWFHCESKQMVADKLGVSLSTVGTSIDRIRIKYANAGRPAATKAALVARAIQDGLVSLEEL